ncbi:MAG: acyl-CoA reductase, partial [Alcaligenaceae bacterium]|nr:acyl-CoA reductase [Alcaligenaceae bacterium]
MNSAAPADSRKPRPQNTFKAQAGYVPGMEASDMRRETLCFEAHGQGAEIDVLRPTPAQLATLADSIATAQKRLANLPVMDIVDAIDRTIARMLEADTPERREVERLLPIISGFSPEMTRLGINASLKAFRRPQLLRFLVEDFSDPGLLDDFRPRAKGGWTRACGPA